MSKIHKDTHRDGKWMEIYTHKKSHIPGYYEATEGHVHSEGWACTCGCNKRIAGRKHSAGPPRMACNHGFILTTPAATQAYRDNYQETFGHD